MLSIALSPFLPVVLIAASAGVLTALRSAALLVERFQTPVEALPLSRR
jgi:hypothetical protein